MNDTRVDADPTDGRLFIGQPRPDNAIDALMESAARAKTQGREWTPADAYSAVRHMVKRGYR